MTASATVNNANITQVVFYNGTSLVGTTTQSPYSVIFPDFDAGTFTFTAQATDNFGTTTTSSPITVTVQAASSGTGTGSGSGEMVYDIHTDQLNTPRVITDSNGNTVWQNDNTEPFGSTIPNQSRTVVARSYLISGSLVSITISKLVRTTMSIAITIRLLVGIYNPTPLAC